MKIFDFPPLSALRTFALASLILMLSASAYAQESSCVTCHRDLEDKRLSPPVEEWEASAHKEGGVGCDSCHGGDPSINDVDAMATQDFIGVPTPIQIPELCSSCHSDPDKMRKYNLRVDEYDLFMRSGHGRALYERSDTKVATCVSCHGSHKILSKDDPNSPVHYTNIAKTCGRCHSDPEYMTGYKLPTDQVEKYNMSYHSLILHGEVPGKNPALAPTCASCHTHSPLLPGATDVPEICGRCHSVTEKYFKSGPHYVALTETGVPRCIDCHGNHAILYPSINMFSSEDQGHCGYCHDTQSAEYKRAQEIRGLLVTAEQNMSKTKQEIADIENSGRNLNDLRTLEEGAQTSLTEVLPITHTLMVDRIKEKTDRVGENSEKVIQIVNAYKAQLGARKKNLAVVLGLILVIIAFLVMKLRSLPHP